MYVEILHSNKMFERTVTQLRQWLISFSLLRPGTNSRLVPSVISGGQCDNGTGFPPCTLISLPKHHFTNVSYPFIHLAIMLYSPSNW